MTNERDGTQDEVTDEVTSGVTDGGQARAPKGAGQYLVIWYESLVYVYFRRLDLRKE